MPRPRWKTFLYTSSRCDVILRASLNHKNSHLGGIFNTTVIIIAYFFFVSFFFRIFERRLIKHVYFFLALQDFAQLCRILNCTLTWQLFFRVTLKGGKSQQNALTRNLSPEEKNWINLQYSKWATNISSRQKIILKLSSCGWTDRVDGKNRELCNFDGEITSLVFAYNHFKIKIAIINAKIWEMRQRK